MDGLGVGSTSGDAGEERIDFLTNTISYVYTDGEDKQM